MHVPKQFDESEHDPGMAATCLCRWPRMHACFLARIEESLHATLGARRRIPNFESRTGAVSIQHEVSNA
jgi:hypothetical protein